MHFIQMHFHKRTRLIKQHEDFNDLTVRFVREGTRLQLHDHRKIPLPGPDLPQLLLMHAIQRRLREEQLLLS
jgi:hypothetical protein